MIPDPRFFDENRKSTDSTTGVYVPTDTKDVQKLPFPLDFRKKRCIIKVYV